MRLLAIGTYRSHTSTICKKISHLGLLHIGIHGWADCQVLPLHPPMTLQKRERKEKHRRTGVTMAVGKHGDISEQKH